MRQIFAEEATRVIAVLAALLFVVWPVCYAFGLDMNRVASLTALPLLLSFLALAPLRSRTVLPVAVTTWRGRLALDALAYIIGALILLVLQMHVPMMLALQAGATVVTMFGMALAVIAWVCCKVWQLDRRWQDG